MSVIDEIWKEAYAEAKAKASIEERTRIATECIKLGSIPLESIAKACKLPLTQVQELAKSLQTS